MKKIELALTLFFNEHNFYQLNKIEDKKISKTFKKFKNIKELNFHILELVEKEKHPAAKMLRAKIYPKMGETFRKKAIICIKEYIEDIWEDEIVIFKKINLKKDSLLTHDRAKKYIETNLYYNLSTLEYKEKNYEDALEYIEKSIFLSELKSSFIELKVKILIKLKKKEEALTYLKSLKEEDKYQTASLTKILELSENRQHDMMNRVMIKNTINELINKLS